MKTIESKMEAYNEAVAICDRHFNYTGDKRKLAYKRLDRAVVEVYLQRMNNFGKQLGLPTYQEKYY